MFTVDQITDIAFEVVSELEPRFSYDVFDVSDSQIIFQDERGLFKVSLSHDGLLKDHIKAKLCKRD